MSADPVEVLKARSKEVPFARLMNMQALEVKKGYAKVSMKFRPDMRNLFGQMHGGAVFALLDEAFSLACNAHGTVAVALELSIYYLAPAAQGAMLIAEVTEENRTRKTGLYQAEVYEKQSGRVIAKAQAMAYRKGVPLPLDEKGRLLE